MTLLWLPCKSSCIVAAPAQADHWVSQQTRPQVVQTQQLACCPQALQVLRSHQKGLRGQTEGLRGQREGLRGHREGPRGHREGLRGCREDQRGHREGLRGHQEGLRGHEEGLRGAAAGTKPVEGVSNTSVQDARTHARSSVLPYRSVFVQPRSCMATTHLVVPCRCSGWGIPESCCCCYWLGHDWRDAWPSLLLLLHSCFCNLSDECSPPQSGLTRWRQPCWQCSLSQTAPVLLHPAYDLQRCCQQSAPLSPGSIYV